MGLQRVNSTEIFTNTLNFTCRPSVAISCGSTQLFETFFVLGNMSFLRLVLVAQLLFRTDQVALPIICYYDHRNV